MAPTSTRSTASNIQRNVSNIESPTQNIANRDRQPDDCQTNTQNQVLTYRQNRRKEQAERAAKGHLHKRGPSRGLKSRRWREKHPTEKPFAKISDSMRRVVGAKAAQFISDCSRWVKEYCPVNARNWVRMDKDSKERLYNKIQGEWNLPRVVAGVSVRAALSSQCAALFRGYRYRLKERYYVGFSKDEAKANKPAGIEKSRWEWLIDDYWSDPKQQRISEKNKRNKQKQTIKHSNGAKSTARILEDMMTTPPPETQNSPEDGEGSPENENGQSEEPIYVKLYEKTHRHVKTGLMEPDAEANLKALRELHEKEIQEHGVDTLTPHDAYPRVLKECSGYIRGLGAGPKPPRKPRNGIGSDEVRDEIQQLEQAASMRENALRAEIGDLKSDNSLLREEMERMKQEMIERENKMRQEMMAEMMRMMRQNMGHS